MGGGVAEVAVAAGAGITRAAAGADESSLDRQAQSAKAIRLRSSARRMPAMISPVLA
jgi:hypothetical protein